MLLSVDKLNTHYGRAHILHDVGLNVAPGEVVVLLGRNGAGKSTTMKSIMGLVSPTSGTVVFNGESIGGEEAYQIARRGIGYVPEDRRIFTSLTVAENLRIGRQSRDQSKPAWDEDRLLSLFPNLADMLKRSGNEMSGGEQQMLTVARAMMGNPSLLLMDEPSEGLAPVFVERLAMLIAELKRSKVSILLTEQDTRLAADVADRAYVIEKGTVCFSGTISEIEADDEIKSQFLAI